MILFQKNPHDRCSYSRELVKFYHNEDLGKEYRLKCDSIREEYEKYLTADRCIESLLKEYANEASFPSIKRAFITVLKRE